MDLLNEKDHLLLLNLMNEVDTDFYPALSSRVNLNEYALKLLKGAVVFGAYNKGSLIGAIAIYMNDVTNKYGYCPFIAVLPCARGQGVSRKLIEVAIAELKIKKFNKLALTVRANSPASSLYKSVGFQIIDTFIYQKTDIIGYEMELGLL